MRHVVSWNSEGRWTQPNVTASHKDAARRWGAEYVCIERLTCSPFADKAKILGSLKGRDQVVWLDGDAIVRYDCPSLFEIVPPDCFAGVPNYQEDTHDGDPWRYHESDWQWCVGKYGRLDMMYDPQTFINGGVLVFTPDIHGAIWDVDFPSQPNAEQTLMNFRADMLGLKRMTLPYTFNRIGEEAWRTGPMTRFIQHLACYRFATSQRLRKDRDAVLREIDWTSKAASPQAVAA